MIVKTINPVIINKKRISVPSKYLSFVGTGISKEELMKFQQFANSKGWSPALVVDGVWGTKTQKAIDSLGSDYDKSLATSTTGATSGGSTSGGSTSGGSTSGGVTGGTPSMEEQTKRAKRGQVWEKGKGWVTSGKAKTFLDNAKGLFGGLFGAGANAPVDNTSTYVAPETTPETKKGLSKGAKIGIAVGVALVLGLIVYKVTRKK